METTTTKEPLGSEVTVVSETIVGMMWNKNEGDILREIIEAALTHVDTLFIADDYSTDNSWDIINSFGTRIEYKRNEKNDPRDVGQRQSLLEEIQKRYKPEDTWVQVIESDIMILDTDIRAALDEFAVGDVAMMWQVCNAVRLPGTWEGHDNYPNWPDSIAALLPYAHRLEQMVYTFRPMPKLAYNLDNWRPWPQGFSHYPAKNHRGKRKQSPLLAHYGYRGLKHFFQKYNPKGIKMHHRRNPTWDLSSLETIEKTVPFFNGQWNNHAHNMNRQGWIDSRSAEQWRGLSANDG